MDRDGIMREVFSSLGCSNIFVIHKVDKFSRGYYEEGEISGAWRCLTETKKELDLSTVAVHRLYCRAALYLFSLDLRNSLVSTYGVDNYYELRRTDLNDREKGWY